MASRKQREREDEKAEEMIEDGCLAYRFGVSRGQSRGSRQITAFVKCNGKSTRDQIAPRPKEKLRMKP